MTDRTVSAQLRLDPAAFIAGMRAARAELRRFQTEASRAGRQADDDFGEAEGGAERLERSINRLMQTERQRTRQQRESTQETRRNTQETQQNREETDRSQRSTERARDSRGRFTRSTDDNTRSQDRNRRSTESSTRALEAHASMLTSVISAAAAVALAETSAAAAVGAFGLLAAPSIAKVVTAQEDLSANWDSLSRLQKGAALQVRNLGDEYEDLARSFQPEAMGAFNSVLGVGAALLPKFARLADVTATDVQGLIDRIGGFATGPEMDGFLRNAERNAPQALHELGTAATSTGSLALRLATDLTPVGLSFLSVANGALGLVNGLAHVNPAFAQLAVTGLLLRAPLLGIASGATNMAGRMRAGLAATRGLTAGQRALQLVTRAGPALFVAAGVGLAFMAIRAQNAKSAHEGLLEAMRIEARATGNNLAGHQAYTQQLRTTADTIQRQLAVAMAGYTAQELRSGDATAAHNRRISELRDKYRETQQTLEQQRQTMERVERGADLLANKYGVTRNEALQLATASGVDLTQAMQKNGQLTNDAAAKINNYRIAVEGAKDPTMRVKLALDQASNSALSAKDRMTALTQAFDAYFNPSLQVFQATTNLRQGFTRLAEAEAKAHGRMDGTSAASIQLRQEFANQLGQVRDLSLAIQAKALAEGRGEEKTKRAAAAVGQQLPLLLAMAGRNRDARAQVDALAASVGLSTHNLNVSRSAFLRVAAQMSITRGKAESLWREFNKIKSRDIDLTVNARGLWTTAHDPGRRIPGLAAGGPVPAIGPESTEAYDSVPAMLRVNEHVWTPEEVRSVGGHGAMLRMRALARRGELQGFATGGPVNFAGRGTVSRDVGTVMRPLYAGMSDLVDKIGTEMGSQWQRFMQSGGPVVAAARTQLGVPYVWGGTAWNSGLDCSGLTSGAWQRGGGVWIGRTTYDQFPHSSHLSGPRPGALGFPHMGHVVLSSGRGQIIEAPYTGASVREVPISRHYEWRWPNAAHFAEGGEVERLGRRFLTTSSPLVIREAKGLGIAGDPGGEQHVAQIAPGAGPLRVWAEPETGGEAYIPLALSKRAQSTRILSAVANRFGMAVRRMADGGILGDAGGFLDLSGALSLYDETYPSASASDLAAARGGVKTQRGQLDAARRSLAAAERSRADRIRAAQKRLQRAYASSGKGRANRIEDAREALAKAKRTDAIRAAEARLKKERGDLTAATKKLSDTEKRYQLGRQSPTTKLSGALSLSIKNKAAFIANLTKLSDRGFGTLARELLNMGGTEAEKLAADAVKLSDKSLTGLQGKLGQAKQQQDTLEALPNILTTRSALRGGQVRTWQDLLKATGLSADDLSKAVRLMRDDLLKTTAGKTIWAQMIADGYATGGWITGRAGTDRVPIRATAGEYMINAGAARQRAALVEAINAGASDAVLRRLIPAAAAASVPVAGGDGASAPLVGEVHVNHVPGYSTPQDVVRALRHVEMTTRYHRKR